MSETVIKVEELGKLYKLGEISTGTISHDLKRWWALARGKGDPFAKIGSTNDRTVKGENDYVWALKDVNFEVKKGEALGIIGRNGAGKSTLLKLLSKVTSPSVGRIKVKGRIASLLEVGTGFHPELTGRENIFLNGAILGMTKAEIRSKFEEIVDFSGVERYIDTPVKRYSSGMYVRLAFAVAAHLEPEILIVDEVLAVGDAEFQKKCLGKMKDVSENGGRSVLFVSHNMGAIAALCSSCLLLKNGTFKNFGPTEKIISEYMRIGEGAAGISEDNKEAKPDQKLKIRKVRILDDAGNMVSEIDNSGRVFVEISFDVFKEGKGYDLSFELSHSQYGIIFGSSLKDANISTFSAETMTAGFYTYKIELPVDYLRGGDYLINVSASVPKVEVLDIFKYETEFSLIDSVSPVARTTEGRQGIILPVIKWNKLL